MDEGVHSHEKGTQCSYTHRMKGEEREKVRSTLLRPAVDVLPKWLPDIEAMLLENEPSDASDLFSISSLPFSTCITVYLFCESLYNTLHKHKEAKSWFGRGILIRLHTYHLPSELGTEFWTAKQNNKARQSSTPPIYIMLK